MAENYPWCKEGYGYIEKESTHERKLTKKAKLMRRLFAAHYVKTSNQTEAARFAGFKSPHNKGGHLLKEPFVQKLVRDLVNELELDSIISTKETLLRLREEATDPSSPANVRVTALGIITKVHGMQIDKTHNTGDPTAGVMLLPAVTNAEDWNAMASEAQAKLKQEVTS